MDRVKYKQQKTAAGYPFSFKNKKQYTGIAYLLVTAESLTALITNPRSNKHGKVIFTMHVF